MLFKPNLLRTLMPLQQQSSLIVPPNSSRQLTLSRPFITLSRPFISAQQGGINHGMPTTMAASTSDGESAANRQLGLGAVLALSAVYGSTRAHMDNQADIRADNRDKAGTNLDHICEPRTNLESQSASAAATREDYGLEPREPYSSPYNFSTPVTFESDNTMPNSSESGSISESALDRALGKPTMKHIMESKSSAHLHCESSNSQPQSESNYNRARNDYGPTYSNCTIVDPVIIAACSVDAQPQCTQKLLLEPDLTAGTGHSITHDEEAILRQRIELP